MLSSVAERVYWLGRYLERAENAARLLKVYSAMLFDLPRGTSLDWSTLIDISGSHEKYEEHYDNYDEMMKYDKSLETIMQQRVNEWISFFKILPIKPHEKINIRMKR